LIINETYTLTHNYPPVNSKFAFHTKFFNVSENPMFMKSYHRLMKQHQFEKATCQSYFFSSFCCLPLLETIPDY